MLRRLLNKADECMHAGRLFDRHLERKRIFLRYVIDRKIICAARKDNINDPVLIVIDFERGNPCIIGNIRDFVFITEIFFDFLPIFFYCFSLAGNFH